MKTFCTFFPLRVSLEKNASSQLQSNSTSKLSESRFALFTVLRLIESTRSKPGSSTEKHLMKICGSSDQHSFSIQNLEQNHSALSKYFRKFNSRISEEKTSTKYAFNMEFNPWWVLYDPKIKIRIIFPSSIKKKKIFVGLKWLNNKLSFAQHTQKIIWNIFLR